MIDALFTLAFYTAIALSLLGMAVVLGAMVLEALHWGEDHIGYDDLEPVDDSDWRDWDWPIPDDLNAWNLPKSEFEERKAS